MAATTGLTACPARLDRGAPSWKEPATGDSVTEYLNDVEALFEKHGILSDEDKKTLLCRYATVAEQRY